MIDKIIKNIIGKIKSTDEFYYRLSTKVEKAYGNRYEVISEIRIINTSICIDVVSRLFVYEAKDKNGTPYSTFGWDMLNKYCCVYSDEDLERHVKLIILRELDKMTKKRKRYQRSKKIN